MNNPFKLKIKTPCQENFNHFTTTPNGVFCSSCNQEVIDFTKMNSDEIIEYFKSKKSKNTCGRFNSAQLQSHSKKSKGILNLFSGLAFSILSIFSSEFVNAQVINEDNKEHDPSKINDITQEKEINVQGTVIDENGLPLPGVNIIVKGTVTGTQTNFDGEFEFPEKLKKGDALSFSFLGYETREIIINGENLLSKIQMEVNMDSMEMVVMGKVATKGIYKSK
jgi:hypothetical protein